MRKATNRLLLGLVGLASTFGLILGGKAIVEGVTNPLVEANAIGLPNDFERLENLDQIHEGDLFVLGSFSNGDSDKFVGYTSGLEKWGSFSDVQTEWSLFSLTVGNGSTFKASATIDDTVYYLTVPTSNDWKMDSASTASNTDLALGTTTKVKNGEDGDFAIANANNLGRHIRLNGTSGFRSYSGTTGEIAYFYKIPAAVEIPSDAVLSSVKLELGTGATSFEQYSTFVAEGYLVTAVYTDTASKTYEKALPLDYEGLTWNLDTSSIGKTDLTVTYNDGKTSVTSNGIEVEITEIPASTTYQLSEIPGFDKWTSSYTERSADYTDFTLEFDKANKQGSNITDIPVTKAGTATLASKEKTIVGIEFGFRQWEEKTQNITLSVGDSADKVTQVKSLSFPSGGTSISYQSADGFKAVVVKAMSGNQIGWEYVTIEFAGESESEVNTYAGKFLDTMTCSENSVTADDGAWDQMATGFDSLSDADKKIFQEAKADASSQNIVEQAVARYDRIVGKYGTDMYKDFMGRNPSPISGAYVVNASGMDNSIFAIAGIACAAVLATGVLLLIRKKQRA